MHTIRANYQVHIWQSCMMTMTHIPSSDGFGWTVQDAELMINWSEENAAPDVVLELMLCKNIQEGEVQLRVE